MTISEVPASVGRPGDEPFRHEAVLYAGDEGFVAGTLPLLEESLAAGDPALAMVSDHRIGLLRDALGSRAEQVHFADMTEVGRNPARIIPAWQAFVERHAEPGRMLRGIGEPIWAGRSSDELAECHLHESLLNLAFADTPFRLLCPYDVEALDEAVIREAAENHPVLLRGAEVASSPTYRGTDGVAAPFALPLPPSPAGAATLDFTAGRLGPVRRFIDAWCDETGIADEPRDILQLAASELVTNSIVHGGGGGTLLLWRDGGLAVGEVRDSGLIDEPMVGRRRPPATAAGGRGLWLVNQLCDLVQIRSGPGGTTVRLHVGLAHRPAA